MKKIVPIMIASVIGVTSHATIASANSRYVMNNGSDTAVILNDGYGHVNKRCDLRALNVYDSEGLPLYHEIGSCEIGQHQVVAKETAHKKTVVEKAPKDRPNPGKPGKDKPRPETPVVEIDPDTPPTDVEPEDRPVPKFGPTTSNNTNAGGFQLARQVGIENSKKSKQAKGGGSAKSSRQNAGGKQNSDHGSRQNAGGKSGRR